MVRTVSLLVGIVLVVTVVCFSQNALPSDRVPVLVELFTSEGCSSCPPADHFLELLDTQPVPGVVSEHVDYWDHQGWRDPYSSSEFTDRQRIYGRQLHLSDVYTPQFVIDGYRQISGNGASDAEVALRQARTRPKTELHITEMTVKQSRLRAHIESTPLNLPDIRSLDVYVVVALNHAESQVTRGENANRHLTHTAVVLKLKRVGKVVAGAQFSQDTELKIDAKTDPRNLRLVAFLQDPNSRRVFGATMRQVEEHRADSSVAATVPDLRVTTAD